MEDIDSDSYIYNKLSYSNQQDLLRERVRQQRRTKFLLYLELVINLTFLLTLLMILYFDEPWIEKEYSSYGLHSKDIIACACFAAVLFVPTLIGFLAVYLNSICLVWLYIFGCVAEVVASLTYCILKFHPLMSILIAALAIYKLLSLFISCRFLYSLRRFLRRKLELS